MNTVLQCLACSQRALISSWNILFLIKGNFKGSLLIVWPELDWSDFCWVDRKASLPLIITALRGGRWGHLEAGFPGGTKWGNHQFRQHGQILLLKHCWSDLITGSLHREPAMGPGMSPELTPHPDEDDAAPGKDEQNFIPYRRRLLSRPRDLLCAKTYTLTCSVYKEQMHTSLESVVAARFKKWAHKLKSSGRERRWKWIFFTLWWPLIWLFALRSGKWTFCKPEISSNCWVIISPQ